MRERTIREDVGGPVSDPADENQTERYRNPSPAEERRMEKNDWTNPRRLPTDESMRWPEETGEGNIATTRPDA